MITAQRLHGRVVNDADWFAKRLLEGKSNPSLAQMFWLTQDALVAHGRWEPYRDRVEFPVADQWFHLGHERAGRQVQPGFEFSFVTRRDHQFDVGSADIDDQNLFLHEDCFGVEVRPGDPG